jgi:broad specificity phosphatase PhoE
MVEIVRYLTHPQVVIDPDVAVRDWGLDATGKARRDLLARSGKLGGTRRVFSSVETKAQQTAEPLATALGCGWEICKGMHENDRSSTGYLPPPDFAEGVQAFFAHPHESWNGWERAIDAQARICRAVEDALRAAPEGDLLMVGHGAVGTLLWCAWSGMAINQEHDQAAGGGCIFSFHRRDRKVLSEWQPLESLL